MKAKAVDIAYILGISKSTVSLALNNRPGVKEETVRRIFEVKERLENGTLEPPVRTVKKETIQESSVQPKKIIKIITLNKHIGVTFGTDLGIFDNELYIYEREASLRGYAVSTATLDFSPDSRQKLMDECNQEYVAGVIVQGAELVSDDLRCLSGIHKPVVLADVEDKGGKYYSISQDNYGGMTLAVEYLLKCGHRDILYVRSPGEISNLAERRKSFTDTMSSHNISDYYNRFLVLDSEVDDICKKAVDYFVSHRLPQAIITEHYKLTIGVIHALDRLKIRIPEDVSLVGFDPVPSYIIGDRNLTYVGGNPIENDRLQMLMLDAEIHYPSETKAKIKTYCKLFAGDTVKKV